MDPDAALENLIKAALDGDADGVMEYAEALSGWLERGGFVPGVEPLQDFVDSLEDDEDDEGDPA